MGYFRQFDDFDPLNEKLDTYPLEKLRDIVSRARKLLKGRTREQIKAAAGTIDWLIEEYFEQEKQEFIDSQLRHGGWALGYLRPEDRHEAGLKELIEIGLPDEAVDYFDFPMSENTTEFEALQCCISWAPFDGDDEFPNAQEWEYFAVLALWLAVDASSWLKYDFKKAFRELPEDVQEELLKTFPKSEPGKGDLGLAAKCALESLEAICYAETLFSIAPLQNELHRLNNELFRFSKEVELKTELAAKNKMSETARKAARVRHAEGKAAKEQLYQWYLINKASYSSMEDAAFAATKIVPYKVRTLRNWISDFNREIRSARKE